eukprot:scaffold872_cov119-Skeletonema_dohrnii-CCMP3373.AAC.14
MGPLRCPPPVYGGSNHRSAPYHRHRRRHGYCVKVSARVKVLTKRGANAVSDCVGSPFPAESAPQILGRAKNRKPKSLH